MARATMKVPHKEVRFGGVLAAMTLLIQQSVLESQAQISRVELAITAPHGGLPVSLCWNTGTSAWYQLEYCSSLTTPQWRPFSAAPSRGTGNPICINDAGSVGEGQRFYRVAIELASGQGYLQFANLGAGVNSPFRVCADGLISGSGYSVEMLVGSNQNFVTNSLAPLFTGAFSPPGYFNGGPRFVPAMAINGSGRTWVIIRVWANAGGTITSYLQALAAGQPTASTPAFQVTPQQNPAFPANPLVGMPLINGTGGEGYICGPI